MAEEDIELKIKVEGGEQAARSVDAVTDSLERQGHAADDAGAATQATEQSFTELARGGHQLVQRVQGVAGAIQGLTTAFGSHDRTAGLIASIAGTTAQFAAMGSMLGPGGTVVGAVAGFVTSIAGLVSAHNSAAEAARDQAGAVEELGTAYENLGAVIMEWAEEGAVDNAIRAGGGRLNDARIATSRLEAELRERQARILELRAADAESGALERTEEEVRLRAEVADLEAELRNRSRGGEDPDQTGGTRSRGATRERTRTPNSIDAMNARDDAAIAREAEEFEFQQAATMRALEAAREEVEIEEDKRAAILELEREGYEAQAELAEEHAEYVRELADEESENRKERWERDREESISIQTELMQMGMQTTKMLTKAIGDVVTGSKTGEEAFRGLLSSFLEMISEYAALSAAREFADAISSFASQNYAGGAQHLAAGIAFTALAVATGVGAAVAAPPAKETAKPAEREMTGAQGGSVTNVINWNSPVVTAGTRAELGREIEGLMSEAEAA